MPTRPLRPGFVSLALTRNESLFVFLQLMALLLVLVGMGRAASDQKPVPLYLFDQGINAAGFNPIGGVISDADGNLYGTTQGGGENGFGVVYKLTPTSEGLWKETILWNFKGSPTDGATSDSTLLMDSAGNLYGTTLYGGLKNQENTECSNGCGVVFELSPSADGKWTETIIHPFTGGLDGANPVAGLIQDEEGNLYGTAAGGGSAQVGTVFRLTHTSAGWKETVLHNFGGGNDGASPYAPVAFDQHGNLYGTTLSGGTSNLGTVFQLSRESGSWTETTLHSFAGGDDGIGPLGGVVVDRDSNVYGGSQQFSSDLPCGTVFVLTAAQNYAETILHSFEGTFNGNDGCNPNQLVFDKKGNLYGTSQFGGVDNAGTIFKLTRESSGFSYSILHQFIGDRINSTDGEFPFAQMTFDPNGNLLSTSLGPGFPAGGEVFSFAP